ncbi:hypothetical protein TeGR_g3134, partial [Tetraparma gracilis]
PENHISIKPYTDPKDRQDRSLERLLPILIEIARHNYNVPALLGQFEGMSGEEIADEYRS